MGWFSNLFEGSSSKPIIVLAGTRFTPEKFGRSIAVWAVDGSADPVNQMIKTGIMGAAGGSMFRYMDKVPKLAQAHFIALDCSTYLAYLEILPGVTDETFHRVHENLSNTLGHSSQGESFAAALKQLIGVYKRSISVELQALQIDRGLSAPFDQTAKLVCRFLRDGYRRIPGNTELPEATQLEAVEDVVISAAVNAAIVGKVKAFQTRGLYCRA